MATPEITPAAERVSYRTPAADVFEDDQALSLSVELPGVASGDVEIGFDGGVLTLTGRVASSNDTPVAYRRRFAFGEPGRFDADHATAVLRNGVLELRVPKAERAKPRQIPVTCN